jgi:hypothetical protein
LGKRRERGLACGVPIQALLGAGNRLRRRLAMVRGRRALGTDPTTACRGIDPGVGLGLDPVDVGRTWPGVGRNRREGDCHESGKPCQT